jgi:catechol 2,3-dioxygenase-like lactoylglutathione lyase family enzyme
MSEILLSQLAHAELISPKPEQTVRWMIDVLGLEETAREGQSVYHGWAEWLHSSLIVTEGPEPALGHSTLGPWIVTPDTLANMASSFEELVAYASRGTWIRPGDVLGSGTCGSGCLIELRGRDGADGHPWLVPGDTVSLTVQGIGTLTNTVVPGVDPVALPPARPGRLRARAAA